MSEPQVRINGKVFLYKQKAPFVPSGVSIQGALEYDEEEDKVRCHECGEWFEWMGPHVWFKHGMTARQYKIAHGLNLTSALINERGRIARALGQASRGGEQLRGKSPRSGGRYTRRACNFESRNARGRCAAQLLDRIKHIALQLGRSPSQRDLEAHGVYLPSAYRLFGVNDIRSLLALADLAPAGVRYSPALLGEMLRDFYVRFRRLPSGTDFKRGVLPSWQTFYNHFGSMPNAYKAAGLGLVARRRRAA
jgi:hypothetical protein